MRKWLVEETGEERQPKKGEFYLKEVYEHEDDEEYIEIFVHSSHNIEHLKFPILRVTEITPLELEYDENEIGVTHEDVEGEVISVNGKDI